MALIRNNKIKWKNKFKMVAISLDDNYNEVLERIENISWKGI